MEDYEEKGIQHRDLYVTSVRSRRVSKALSATLLLPTHDRMMNFSVVAGRGSASGRISASPAASPFRQVMTAILQPQARPTTMAGTKVSSNRSHYGKMSREK